MHRRGFTDGVMAARLSVGHGWSDPVRLSEDRQVPGYPQDGKGAWGADDVDLAVSPRGAVSVAWDWGSEERHKAWRIQSVYQSPRHGWSRVAHVTRATGAQQPQVGIAGDGTVTLAYGHQSPGHHQHLLARRLRPGRAWSRADVVTRRGYDPKLQVDRAGDALLVYTPNSSRIMAAYRGPGGRWKEPRRLTPVGVRTDGFFDLAMNGRGAALVAWERGGRIDLVRRPPQGPWSAPVRVVEGSELSSEVVVALNGAGDTFLAWGMYALHGCYRAHDGTWSNPVTLSPDAAVDVLESVRAGVTPDGHAVLMWTQEARGLKVRIGSTS
ncbi:MAG: hypothetical protein J2P22_07490 [Nocardioides sp.]|nr:hypothetical protein [Nocardioides sp.]